MPELIINHSQLLELSAEILNQGSSFRFQARGTSMTPLIRQGDIITIQPVDLSDLRVGDVILFQTAFDKLVAHRIIDIGVENGQIQFVARGDAILGSGEKVHADMVLGQVVRIERGSRVMHLDMHYWRSLGILWGKLAPFTLRCRSFRFASGRCDLISNSVR